MMVKRFNGRTAEEALALAKWELGEDAVILSAGQLRDRWWKFWEHGFQVLVAADAVERKPSAPRVVSTIREAAQPIADDPIGRAAERLEHLVKTVEDRLARTAQSSDENLPGVAWLIARGLAPTLAQSLAAEIGDEPEGWEQRAVTALLGRLPAITPIGLQMRQTVMFVGPTGSGKTTTIAKLAAYFALERKISVLLITTDIFRVGAVDQLEAFAEIVGVPFRIARKPKELAEIIRGSDAQLIFVDTQGHSLRDSLHMATMRSMADLAEVDAVILTISAVMSPADIRAVAAEFLGARAGRICITKADEAQAPGGVLGSLIELGFPLSYITNGQGVPEDVQVVVPERLGEWFLTGHYHG